MLKKFFRVSYISFFILFVLTALEIKAMEINNVKVLYNSESNALVVKAGDRIDVEVAVKGKEEQAFVGATIVDPEGDEIDFLIKKVYCEKGIFGGMTTSKVTLSATITEDMDAGFANADGLRLIVRLWKYAIRRSECRRTDPSDGERPCKFCRRNGYHMESPIGEPFVKMLPGYMVSPDEFRWDD